MMNGGVALGPILIGLMYDFGGGYQNAFIVVSMTSILAFVALRLAGSPVGVSAAFESDASES
jgi:cyanate permease